MTRLLQTFKNAGRTTAAHTTRTIPRQIRDRKVDKDDADDRQHDECDECDECEECDEEHEELRQQPRTTPTKSSWWPGVGEDWWRRLEVSKSRKVSKERRAMRERQHGACEHSRWRAANAMGHAGLLS